MNLLILNLCLIFLSLLGHESELRLGARLEAFVIRSSSISQRHKGVLLRKLIKPGMTKADVLAILGREQGVLIITVGPKLTRTSWDSNYMIDITWDLDDAVEEAGIIFEEKG
jgi:hypothetical protein